MHEQFDDGRKMSASSKDQVALVELLFGMSWEDPASDRLALAVKPGETLMTVTSGACNTLTLLLEDPGRIYAVDINPAQSYLLELKCAAVRHLEYDELRAFLGLAPSHNRLQVYDRLRSDLSEAALRYWNSHSGAVRNGVANAGRYESFTHLFSRFVALTQGKKRIDGFFQCTSLEEQRNYFNTRWNTVQWRLLFKLLANKRMLAKRGLTADYFKFDDGSSSFPESFFRRSKHGLCEIPIGSNYFIAQYLLGRYWSEEAVPEYLQKANLPVVRQRLDRIKIITCDAQGWFRQQVDSSIDGFILSNICELMSEEETNRLFTEVARCARDGARICFRNLIIPRDVSESLRGSIALRDDLSHRMLAADRSFVYSRVRAYVARVNSGAPS
jgi:S-adenosylmethionine-diacylglycerol 3-amino-3-carboxypropyl transferase